MKKLTLFAAVVGLTVAMSGCSGIFWWQDSESEPAAADPVMVAQAVEQIDAEDNEAYVRDDSALFVISNRGGAAVRQHEAAHVLYDDHHVGMYRQTAVHKVKPKNDAPAASKSAKPVFRGKSADKKDRSIYSRPAPKKAVKNVRKTVKPRIKSRKIRPNPCTCNCKCDCSVTCAPCAKPEVRVPSAVPSAKGNISEANRIRETCPWPQKLETEPAPSPEVARAMQAEQTVRAMANL